MESSLKSRSIPDLASTLWELVPGLIHFFIQSSKRKVKKNEKIENIKNYNHNGFDGLSIGLSLLAILLVIFIYAISWGVKKFFKKAMDLVGGFFELSWLVLKNVGRAIYIDTYRGR